MAAQNPFRQVGAHWKKEETKIPSHRAKTVPWGAVIILLIVVAAAIGAPIFSNHDVSHYYIDSLNAAPGRDFYFGTDSLGRDLFSCLLYGSRVSLAVGFFSMVIATVTGVVYGSVSAMAPRWVDSLLLRLAELLSSIPSILFMILLLGTMKEVTVLSLSVVIGGTTWMGLARMVRSDVYQIRHSGYVLASRLMGASLWHILRYHIVPNVWSHISFMIVSRFGMAIIMEGTLSFLGLGLPPEILSWGTLLSLATRALLTNSWWVIVFPGIFVVATLLGVTEIGQYARKEGERHCSYL